MSFKGVALSWSPPASDGGAALTGYRVYRGTAPGTETPLASVGAATTYQDTATTRRTRYYYTVAAVNAAGDGRPSNEAHATSR
jgi:titin